MEADKINRKLRLLNYSLIVVYSGATIAFLASLLKLFLTWQFPLATFAFSFLALLASIPVYLEKRKLTSLKNGQDRHYDDW